MDELIFDDKSRICPSCRMSISVLATKCRFCGEVVGKPKEEQRELSISDLGGESIQHHAPSGSLMDAIETYRLEEKMTTDEHAVNQGPVSDALDPDLMPVLDENLQGMVGDAYKPTVATTTAPKIENTKNSKVVATARAAVILVVLLFAIIKAGSYLGDYLDEARKEPVDQFVNRAPNILARGGAPITALEAAIEAIEHNDTPDNRKIAESALSAVVQQVHLVLNAQKYEGPKLRDASALATRALVLYPNDTTRLLTSEVEQDNKVYAMVLTKIDSRSGLATFRPSGSHASAVEVKVGDTLEGRFKVRRIQGQVVKLEDSLRGNRLVTYELGALPY